MLPTLLWNLFCCTLTTVHLSGCSLSQQKKEKSFLRLPMSSHRLKKQPLETTGREIAKRKESVLRKEQESIKNEMRMTETLTKKIQKVGLWTSRTEVEGLKKLTTVTSKCAAPKFQMNFHREVLGQTHADKGVFIFSHKGGQHTHVQLMHNLFRLLHKNRRSKNHLNLKYFSTIQSCYLIKELNICLRLTMGPSGTDGQK